MTGGDSLNVVGSKRWLGGRRPSGRPPSFINTERRDQCSNPIDVLTQCPGLAETKRKGRRSLDRRPSDF
jgi:hypothetical protein